MENPDIPSMTGSQDMKSLIVVSDTHLGLTAGKRLFFFKNTVSHRPESLQKFLEWLKELEEEGEKQVDLGIAPGRTKTTRRLVAPSKLILNGDILELLDASERASELSTRSIFNTLLALKCEKIYLIGNHDFAMKQVEGRYPFGKSPVQIVHDTYPLGLGDNHYLFLHGHQFSWIFRNMPWQIMSYLRDGAEAFGLFAWLLVLAWLIALGFAIPTILGWITLSPWLANVALGAAAVLSLLAPPRVIISVARPIWNLLFARSHRYRRKRAFDGFHGWWKDSVKKIQPVGRIHIVYGHTHLTGVFSKQEVQKELGKTIEGPDFILINHPAWVSDRKYLHWVKDGKGRYTKVHEGVFIYIDADGYEFFRWDEDSCPPVFHIPRELIPPRPQERKLDDKAEAWLQNLRWPEKLLEEWKKPPFHKE